MQRSNQFKPGHNIKGGRPKGSRNKLAQRVFDDILKHWNEPAGARVTRRSRRRRSTRRCSSENSAQLFGVAHLRSSSAVRGCR